MSGMQVLKFVRVDQ